MFHLWNETWTPPIKNKTLRSCISSKNTQRGACGKQSLLFCAELSVLTSSDWISKDPKASSAVCTLFIPVSQSEAWFGKIFSQSAFHSSLIPPHLTVCSICWVILSKCPFFAYDFVARPWTNHLSLFFVRGQVTAALSSLWQWQLTSFVQHPSICRVPPWYFHLLSTALDPTLQHFLDLSYCVGVKYAFQQFYHLCMVILRGTTTVLSSIFYISPESKSVGLA